MFLLVSLLANRSYSYLPGSREAYLSDQRFMKWLEDYEDEVSEQNLDPADIYLNWLQNAKFVDQHNDVQYRVGLNAFAYKVIIWGNYLGVSLVITVIMTAILRPLQTRL